VEGGGPPPPPPHLPRRKNAGKGRRKDGQNPRAQGTDLRTRHRAPRDVGDTKRTSEKWERAARLGLRPHELDKLTPAELERLEAMRSPPTEKTRKQFTDFVQQLEAKAAGKGGA
jgi:hypothetical protein